MPSMLTLLLIGLYVASASLLAIYTCGQLLMLLVYWRTSQRDLPRPPEPEQWPTVLVQLPIYNEQHVVERLLEAVARLDYPFERLHIQILDDSNDSTSVLLTHRIQSLQSSGLKLSHVRREDRRGFKAGALAYGLTLDDSEYVAIFDADFVPPPDFLRRTVPHLIADPALGVVQTRWGHLNAEANTLTRAQRLAIDAHFVIEQHARSAAGWMLPFNGTGGLWRRDCINASGGWSDSTLTEDLDLSYRAQLAGWRSLYLPDLMVPGELPPQMAAYRQQQGRWARGSTQCLMKLGPAVIRARRPFYVRWMGLHQMAQYLPQTLMLALLLLAPPMILLGGDGTPSLAPLGLIGMVPPLMMAAAQRALYASWWRHLLAFPALLLIATGLIWHNSRAVWAALLGRRAAFQRTPKFDQDWQSSSYALRRSAWRWPELLLAVYALWAVFLAVNEHLALVPYLLLYALAFAGVVLWEWRDHRRIDRAARQRPHNRVSYRETGQAEPRRR